MQKQNIRSLADTGRHNSFIYPNKPALIFEERSTTYKELHLRSNQVANGLLEMGTTKLISQPQKRIAYLGKNTDIYFELLLGAAKANVVMVAVNWRLAPEEIKYVLEDSEAELLFVETEFQGVANEVYNDLEKPNVIVVIESSRSESVSQVQMNCVQFREWQSAFSDIDPSIPIAADDVALQMYTSGTTGKPKGVQMTNAGLMALRESEEKAGDWAQWAPDDVSLVAMPVFHIGGTAWGFTGLYQGATNVIMKQADPIEIIRLVERYQVKKLFAVPALLLSMVQYQGATPECFKSVDVVLYGASPIPEQLLKEAMKLFNADFVQLYGMTETTGSMTCLPPDQHKLDGAGRLKSCGRALPGIEIKIVNELGQSVDPFIVGEILIQTPSLMKGYWKRPEDTEKVLQNGWYRSGDAGYLDDEGYLYIHDRMKDMIVSGGENIYPAEIESALFDHPKVKDVAVIGVPSKRWGEEVKAIIVLSENQACEESHLVEELISFCATKIAKFKIPKSIEFTEALPRNHSGKLLKRVLRAPYWEGFERNVN